MKDSSEDDMLDTWKGFLFAHARVIRGLEGDMLEQHSLTLTWFDVMSRLRQAPQHRLRMHELEEASVFTRSGMTRLVDRIEAAGFVRRERTPKDRRGVYVAITPAGVDKIDEVWPDHVASIKRHFGRFMDPTEATALRQATQKIRNGEAGVSD
jgi:DNA-binding MarR family transcriptional regulator